MRVQRVLVMPQQAHFRWIKHGCTYVPADGCTRMLTIVGKKIRTHGRCELVEFRHTSPEILEKELRQTLVIPFGRILIRLEPLVRIDAFGSGLHDHWKRRAIQAWTGASLFGN